MKIIIGSKNPVKVAVVTNVFEEVFADEALEFGTCAALSGVGDQPYGNDEMRGGAHARAQDAMRKSADADFFVGIEGGIEIISGEYWVTAWICILRKDEKVGFGKASAFLLPPAITKLMKEGMELGVASDVVFKAENSKQKEGTIGLLTNGAVTRADFYRDAVRFALIPFTQTELYK